MHKVVFYGIIENMSPLLQLRKYVAINKYNPTTMVYFVIKYLSEPYALQEYQTTYGQVIKAGGPIVKSEYLSLMKAKKIGIGYSMEQIRVS